MGTVQICQGHPTALTHSCRVVGWDGWPGELFKGANFECPARSNTSISIISSCRNHGFKCTGPEFSLRDDITARRSWMARCSGLTGLSTRLRQACDKKDTIMDWRPKERPWRESNWDASGSS